MSRIRRSLAKNTAFPSIEAFTAALVIQDPQLALLGGGFFVLRLAYMTLADLYPTEAEEFIQQVEQNSSKVTDEVLNSPKFRQSMLTTFESLYRARDKRKRTLIKQIYLGGYLPSKDRENINLDRLYDICQRISPEAIEHLRFLQKEILPMKLEAIKAQVAEEKKNTDGNRENSDEWWVELYMRREGESRFVGEWVYRNFNPNSEKVKAETPEVDTDKVLVAQQFEKEKEQQNRMAELTSELISLGIFRQSDAIIGGGLAYHLTDFGKEFIMYLRDIN